MFVHSCTCSRYKLLFYFAVWVYYFFHRYENNFLGNVHQIKVTLFSLVIKIKCLEKNNGTNLEKENHTMKSVNQDFCFWRPLPPLFRESFLLFVSAVCLCFSPPMPCFNCQFSRQCLGFSLMLPVALQIYFFFWPRKLILSRPLDYNILRPLVHINRMANWPTVVQHVLIWPGVCASSSAGTLLAEKQKLTAPLFQVAWFCLRSGK